MCVKVCLREIKRRVGVSRAGWLKRTFWEKGGRGSASLEHVSTRTVEVEGEKKTTQELRRGLFLSYTCWRWSSALKGEGPEWEEWKVYRLAASVER